MMLNYFRGRWPEAVVPEGVPVWLYYEVDPHRDVVLRSVEIFADGRMERNSLALEARDGWACESIVHGPFMPVVAHAKLETTGAETFEALWELSMDKPLA